MPSKAKALLDDAHLALARQRGRDLEIDQPLAAMSCSGAAFAYLLTDGGAVGPTHSGNDGAAPHSSLLSDHAADSRVADVLEIRSGVIRVHLNLHRVGLLQLANHVHLQRLDATPGQFLGGRYVAAANGVFLDRATISFAS
ncbi:hypothetical protein I6F35_37625 [Bradyrhizobium sp. BRP22]|uniref:hypothetical protein n=1 Tax=Bradyrhizobium sp. BRP22 TaxID=2793821 RepID=UPI001CD77548|nr:hypothetical protein [Bradyrhizobium sp. BRP22]MCA1458813.1 hypothetical protein [Bradyrhizobium sp. BRP22]